jgi:hopene-associated glycosyltransferase HpnB
MSWLAFITGICCVSVWGYLLLGRGMFWRISPEHANSASPPPEPCARIAVVVPARDEADVVGQSVTSLLNQTGIGPLHIVLVDDGSSDSTADVAREAAQRAGRAAQLTIITGRPLPPGWTGKLWAVQQGVECALAARPDFVLLTDADILHAPGSILKLVAVCRRGYDMASFMVRLPCTSWAEKLLIPAYVFFFFKLYPPRWIADAHRTVAGAAGGSILVRPEALLHAGGIAAIRGQIIDDCALAKAVKRSGGKVWLGLTPSTSSLRAYGSATEIGRMVARNAFNQLRHSTLLLSGSIVGMMITYVAPVALLFSAQWLPIVLGAAACVMMTVSYAPMVRFYRLNKIWTLTLPLAAIFYVGATVQSAFNFWAGRGGQWKGRAQDQRVAD